LKSRIASTAQSTNCHVERSRDFSKTRITGDTDYVAVVVAVLVPSTEF
jgi:hypothetical protein